MHRKHQLLPIPHELKSLYSLYPTGVLPNPFIWRRRVKIFGSLLLDACHSCIKQVCLITVLTYFCRHTSTHHLNFHSPLGITSSDLARRRKLPSLQMRNNLPVISLANPWPISNLFSRLTEALWWNLASPRSLRQGLWCSCSLVLESSRSISL